MKPHLTVTRRESFSAAHYLRDPNLSDEENLERFGACVRDHGHNYVVEVSVSGESDEHGYVCDLRALGQVLRERVIDDVDHRHLNHDVSWLEGKIPSTEVLALAFWEQLVDHIPQGHLERVRVNETDKNFAECTR